MRVKYDFSGERTGFDAGGLADRVLFHIQGMTILDNNGRTCFSRTTPRGGQILICDNKRKFYGVEHADTEHVGGIDSCGAYVVVPGYNHRTWGGQIAVYNHREDWRIDGEIPVNGRPYAAAIRYLSEGVYLVAAVTEADGSAIEFWEWTPHGDAVYLNRLTFAEACGARNNICFNGVHLYLSRAHLGGGELRKYRSLHCIQKTRDETKNFIQLEYEGTYNHWFIYCSARFGATFDGQWWYRTARNIFRGWLDVRKDLVDEDLDICTPAPIYIS